MSESRKNIWFFRNDGVITTSITSILTMPFHTIQEYYAHVRGKVARSGYSNDWSAIRFNPSGRTTGIVKATPLQFKDGSILNFYEEIVLNDVGIVFRPSYTYHYERSPMELTEEELVEIEVAKETYAALKKQLGTDDVTPELYLLSVFAEYELHENIKKMVAELLQKYPENPVLKQWEEEYGKK